MANLRALFAINNLQSAFDTFQRQVDDKVIVALSYMGETFVNKARSIDTYKDNTGNLRASIGYVIMAHGKVVKSDFKGKPDGQDKGRSAADEIAAQYPYGYVLIGVAGMEYAAAVEARGYDVITSSAVTGKMLGDSLNDLEV